MPVADSTRPHVASTAGKEVARSELAEVRCSDERPGGLRICQPVSKPWPSNPLMCQGTHLPGRSELEAAAWERDPHAVVVFGSTLFEWRRSLG